MRRDTFSDYLESLIQVSRYARSDARVVDALLHAALRVAQAAADVGADSSARAAERVATRIAHRAFASHAIDDEEREAITAVIDKFPSLVGASHSTSLE